MALGNNYYLGFNKLDNGCVVYTVFYAFWSFGNFLRKIQFLVGFNFYTFYSIEMANISC